MADGLLPKDYEGAPRRPTNVSLNSKLLEEAKALGLNVSRACERGLEVEVRAARAKAWKEENREAIEAWNKYVEENGLPLARYRQF